MSSSVKKGGRPRNPSGGSMMSIVSDIAEIRRSCGLRDADILGDLLQRCDYGSDFVVGDNYYTWFHAIGAYFRPRRIVEIGTRFGYSMKAFVKGAGLPAGDYSLAVFDAECDNDNPEPLSVFERYFRTKMNIDRIRIERVITQKIDTLGISEMDLGLVDGDHSRDGCYHDCGLVFASLRAGGVMVVDDTNPGCVRDATEDFCKDLELEFTFLPTLRGCHVIRKVQ